MLENGPGFEVPGDDRRAKGSSGSNGPAGGSGEPSGATKPPGEPAGELLPVGAPTGFGVDLPHELAHALGQFERELPGLEKAFRKAWRGVERAIPKVRMCRADRGRFARELRRAFGREHAAEARLTDSHPVGHPDDRGRRGLSTVGYVLLVALIAAIEFNIDRGALLVLLLPAGLTSAMAVGLVAVSILAAHTAGRVFRRGHDVADKLTNLGWREVMLGRFAFGGGIALAVAVALIRGYHSGLLAGLLFGVAGTLLFLAMVYAAYLHESGAVDHRNQTRRERRRGERRLVDAEGQQAKAEGRYRQALERLRAAAAHLVGRLDQTVRAGQVTWTANHPEGEAPAWQEPGWLTDRRRVANGEIPDALRVDDDPEADSRWDETDPAEGGGELPRGEAA